MVIRVRCTSVSKAGHSRRNLSGLGHDICNAEATQKRRQLLGFARIGRLARTDTSGRLACQTVVAAPRWTAQTPRAPAPAPLSARRHLAATTSPISAGLGLPGRESLCGRQRVLAKTPSKDGHWHHCQIAAERQRHTEPPFRAIAGSRTIPPSPGQHAMTHMHRQPPAHRCRPRRLGPVQRQTHAGEKSNLPARQGWRGRGKNDAVRVRADCLSKIFPLRHSDMHLQLSGACGLQSISVSSSVPRT
jgi:hypothetical protein